MTGEKDVVRLENENKELRQLLDDTLKAVSILNNVVERYFILFYFSIIDQLIC